MKEGWGGVVWIFWARGRSCPVQKSAENGGRRPTGKRETTNGVE